MSRYSTKMPFLIAFFGVAFLFSTYAEAQINIRARARAINKRLDRHFSRRPSRSGGRFRRCSRPVARRGTFRAFRNPSRKSTGSRKSVQFRVIGNTRYNLSKLVYYASRGYESSTRIYAAQPVREIGNTRFNLSKMVYYASRGYESSTRIYNAQPVRAIGKSRSRSTGKVRPAPRNHRPPIPVYEAQPVAPRSVVARPKQRRIYGGSVRPKSR